MNQADLVKAAIWAAFRRGDLTDEEATLELLRLDRAVRTCGSASGIVSLDVWRRWSGGPATHGHNRAA